MAKKFRLISNEPESLNIRSQESHNQVQIRNKGYEKCEFGNLIGPVVRQLVTNHGVNLINSRGNKDIIQHYISC